MSLEDILIIKLNQLFDTNQISIRQERGVIKCFYLGENKTNIRYCTKIFEDLVYKFKTYSEDDMVYYYANKIVEYMKININPQVLELVPPSPDMNEKLQMEGKLEVQ